MIVIQVEHNITSTTILVKDGMYKATLTIPLEADIIDIGAKLILLGKSIIKDNR